MLVWILIHVFERKIENHRTHQIILNLLHLILCSPLPFPDPLDLLPRLL